MIAVLATLDTKGPEAAYAVELLRTRYGREAYLLDVGTVAGPGSPTPTATREEVMAAAGTTSAELATARRDEAMAAMGRGAGRILAALHASGRLRGVLALGGNQGTAIAGIALRALPLGLPKLILSTIASGNVRPHIGHSDTALLFSVADLLGGPNSITGPMIERAVGALVGMVDAARPLAPRSGGRVAALTALGNTEPAARRIQAGLESTGWEVVGFHASGACGSAMEQLVEEGVVNAVVDLTPHELIGDVFPDEIYRPTRPGRLLAAGRKGLPQVVAPGGLEYFCFGPPESIPPQYRGRPTHYHNPFNLNVRATAAELAILGAEMARRLNQALGPVAVLIPCLGWSVVGSPGGPLHDPTANQAFVDALRDELRRDIPVEELDLAINDPPFADRCVDWLARLAQQSERLVPAAPGGSARGGHRHQSLPQASPRPAPARPDAGEDVQTGGGVIAKTSTPRRRAAPPSEAISDGEG